MKFGSLRDVTGKFVEESVEWLRREQCGCCAICFASDGVDNYAVCIGWHHYDDRLRSDGKFVAVWKIAWKVGRQSRNNMMQSDFDIDFEMPYNLDSGELDDTLEVVEAEDRLARETWDGIASRMRRTARRVWKAWRNDK